VARANERMSRFRVNFTPSTWRSWSCCSADDDLRPHRFGGGWEPPHGAPCKCQQGPAGF